VANRPVYLAIGIDCDGAKDVLGMWVGGSTGESSKYWLSVLSELKSRGVADVCIVCCDGLTGLPDAVGVIWPQAVVQTCVVHLIRASLRYASKRDWAALTRDLRSIYTASDEAAAGAALDGFAERRQARYPAIVKLWRTHGRLQCRLADIDARAPLAHRIHGSLPTPSPQERTGKATRAKRCSRVLAATIPST
jgi:putative transposase